MTISVKHKFVSAIADEGDTSLVRPSNWNDTHDIELATARLIGRTSSGAGSAEEISVGTGLNLSSGSLAVSSTTPQVNSINTFTASQVISVTDNSNPALRITQLGTADALLVEDETNPDATPFAITAEGHAIAGATAAATIGSVVPQFQSHTTVATEGGYGGVDWGNTATGQVNWFGKSRGGSYGSQAIVQNNDVIGDFRFYGSDGVGLIPAAKIEVDVDGTPGVNDMPGRIAFFTTADGAATSTERFRIGSAGQLGIGGATYGTSTQYFKSGGSSAAPSWATISNTDISGLGTMSTQNANSVSITGGSITGITDLAVADGGTGASSFTAYAVLAGGTTSTGAVQTVSGLGTSGQVLTSNGAGALPSWANAASGGGMTLLGTLTTTSGTSQSLTGLTLTSYKQITLVFSGVSHNSGTNASFLVGTSTSDDVSVTISANSSATFNGFVFIALSNGIFSSVLMNASAASGTMLAGTTPLSTSSTSISVAPSGGSFDAGSILVYGVS